MHSQLNYMIAQQRSAELQRAGARCATHARRARGAAQSAPLEADRSPEPARLAYTGRFAPARPTYETALKPQTRRPAVPGACLTTL